jgi:hypothetical protein
MPTAEEILLGKIGRTCGSENDAEYYSLHYFVDLASRGQTVAFDMLHANPGHVVKSDELGWIWDVLVENRKLFISKEMKAFTGYARSQAARYSLRGERLNRLIAFRDVIARAPGGDVPLSFFWADLPKDMERTDSQGVRELKIGGKWFGETTATSVVRNCVQGAINQHAADSGGIDWKALSHAVRVTQELAELLTYGEIRFPLQTAPKLLSIKNGELPLEEVQHLLDKELAFVELAMHDCIWPLKVDRTFWDSFVCTVTRNFL